MSASRPRQFNHLLNSGRPIPITSLRPWLYHEVCDFVSIANNSCLRPASGL
ncbi:hypothetical protein HBI56_184000 [Parastagonospora nodorum]|uniref:Uncharacterized protein n=1 Tax=Phaeosphaeria nodorum (strain SN15 / ATCC MYA-4574 / FGSC 10173) TaxID=321614 RepID=A0A7U2FCY6_PHANO|nr:hypothetical protein HBH56_192470 [Parastagonospora nodorum]QRD03017.1 hypothetical protein JI435_418950 [Parastagonospora nodorum SN15]KAH3938024.1 hypothetical protein HBH54_009490 [Parastagonospora nodorum]KAH3940768.1 hypothetical protein HBH53_212820 [Parastagonospora nodorum]KAH3966593.1 hypothetical protein HBH52_198450 [Parastagonospora nodorum]